MSAIFLYIKKFSWVIILLLLLFGLLTWLTVFYGYGEPTYNGTFI